MAGKEPPLWNPSSEGDVGSGTKDDDISSLRKDLNAFLEKDSVGETVFSKSWLLSLLVDGADYVRGRQKKSPAEATCSKGNTKSALHETSVESYTVEVGAESSQEPAVEELDGRTETSMCRLWDCSANKDVARFLADSNSVELLLELAAISSAPRLTEICLGVVGNVACYEELCCAGLSSQASVSSVLALLGSSDPQVIYESLKLAQTCLAHHSQRQTWLQALRTHSSCSSQAPPLSTGPLPTTQAPPLSIQAPPPSNQALPTTGPSPTPQESLLFIMSSSTVVEVLAQAGALVDQLLSLSEELAHSWATPQLLESVLIAAEEIRMSGEVAPLRPFVAILESYSTVDHRAELLEEHQEELGQLLPWYLVEEVNFSDGNCCYGDHSAYFLCGCSVLHFLLVNSFLQSAAADAGRVRAALTLALARSKPADRQPTTGGNSSNRLQLVHDLLDLL